MIHQTSTPWDLSVLDYTPPADEKCFVLLLFIVFVVATVKLARLWLLAPPFRKTLPADLSDYQKRLRLSVNSLSHWRWLPVFGWLFVSAHRLCILVTGYLSKETVGYGATLGILGELLQLFAAALCVVFFLFLSRWHLLNRLTKLNN